MQKLTPDQVTYHIIAGYTAKVGHNQGGLDAGCHTNFPMKSMREKGGFGIMVKIGEAFEKFAAPISRWGQCTRKVALTS